MARVFLHYPNLYFIISTSIINRPFTQTLQAKLYSAQQNRHKSDHSHNHHSKHNGTTQLTRACRTACISRIDRLTKCNALAPGKIPNHRWISFRAETLALSINLTEKRLPLPIEIENLHNLVELYSAYTKICLISIILPEYKDDASNSKHRAILCNLIPILNRFSRISRLEVTFRMPYDNFWQLTNTSQFYRLHSKQWKLHRKIGTEKLEEIQFRSQLDRRLFGRYKVNVAGIPWEAKMWEDQLQASRDKSKLDRPSIMTSFDGSRAIWIS